MQAAELLIEEGYAKAEDFPSDTNGYKPATDEFIDGLLFDGSKPNDYLNSFDIGLNLNTPDDQS